MDMAFPNYKRLTDPILRGRIAELRSSIEPVLGGNYLPSFTDHSVTHSDQVCDLIDKLTEPLGSVNQLSEREAFVLYAACYLHDVGLQHQRADQTPAVQTALGRPEYFGRTWNELDINTRRQIVRNYHHRISQEMILQSINAPQPTPLGIQLTQVWDPGPISSLCIAHCLDVNSNEYREATSDSGELRMSLLSALLHIADILDESRRRSHLFLECTRELDLESRMHWWRHYYVNDVQIDPAARQITIWFEYPRGRGQQYREIIPPLLIPLLEHEFARHEAILARHNIFYHLRKEEVKEIQSTATPMDGELERYIIEKLAADQTEQAERDRLLSLHQLRTARPTIERELSTLRTDSGSMSSDEQLCKFRGLAQHLWHLGGRREAWMTLSIEYDRLKVSVGLTTRIAIAVDLADMMMEDGHSDRAARLLHELRGHADSIQEQTLKWRFLALLGRACIGEYAINEAVATFSAAAQLAPDARSRAQVEAELAEARLLQGDLQNIEPFMDIGKSND